MYNVGMLLDNMYNGIALTAMDPSMMMGGEGVFGGYNSNMFSGYNSNSVYGAGAGFGGNRSAQLMQNMTPKELVEYQAELQKLQLQKQAELKEAANSAQYQQNHKDDVINRQAQILHRMIVNNRQDDVPEGYSKLKSAVITKLKATGLTESQIANMSKDELNAYVEKAYFASNGTQMVEDLENYGNSPFVHGFKRATIGLVGLGNRRSAEENITEITGISESSSDKAAGYLGMAAGVVSGLLAIPFGIKAGAKAGKALFNLIADGFKSLAPVAEGAVKAETKSQVVTPELKEKRQVLVNVLSQIRAAKA